MDSDSQLPCGGIVLCGGESRRMGLAKASLAFGNETLLARVVRIVGEVVEPVVVVRAAGQELPPLPAGIRIAEDRCAGRGPLEGLRAGLEALRGDVARAYVTACDAPLLTPQFVRRIISLAEGYDVAVPWVDSVCASPASKNDMGGRGKAESVAPESSNQLDNSGAALRSAPATPSGTVRKPTENQHFYHPLAAMYAVSLLSAIDELLAAGRLRPLFLFEIARTRRICKEELLDVDPRLDSLRNLNTPDDYLAALADAGLPAPAEVVKRSAPNALPGGGTRYVER